MIWLNPPALFALAAVAAPILIHILVQRRAERFAFPTLRFIAPTRLAAIRRHMLEDGALLAVRVAILAAAAAALAGPLMLTAGRRHAWDQRIVRATVVDALAPSTPRRAEETDAPFLDKTFDAASLTDGIRRAVAWLDAAPPARRELAVVSPFAIGSLTAADISAVPANIGIRLERRGTLPASRSVEGAAVLARGDVPAGLRVLDRRVTFNGPQTTVGESSAAREASWPIEVRAPGAARAAVDAAVQAVLSQRVWMPPSSHRAQLALVPSQVSDTVQALEPWMATAIARMAGDADLQAAASRVATGFIGARYATAPWRAVASAADGRPLAAAAGSRSQLIVVSAASATDLVTPLLIRSIVNGLAATPDLRSAEVVPISDPLLRQWSRPAPASGTPPIENLEQDDRRWFWLAALGLLTIETWMRRARAVASRDEIQEAARVA